MSRKAKVEEGQPTLAPVVPFDKTIVTPQYQVNDWVYYAYELQQVKKLDDKGNVIELSDGNIVIKSNEGSSLNSEMVPLTPENKAASELFKEIAKEFSNYSSAIRLNAQELFPWLVRKWLELIAAGSNEKARESVSKEIQRLRTTVTGAIQSVHGFVFEVTPTEDKKKPSPTFKLFA